MWCDQGMFEKQVGRVPLANGRNLAVRIVRLVTQAHPDRDQVRVIGVTNRLLQHGRSCDWQGVNGSCCIHTLIFLPARPNHSAWPDVCYADNMRATRGLRSLCRAFASTWRMRSRVTLSFAPVSSSVCASPLKPNRNSKMRRSRGVSSS